MQKINFEDGTLVSAGYVEIDGEQHEVTEAVYDGDTPLSSFVLNKMQDNIEKELDSNKVHIYKKILSEAVGTGIAVTIPCYYKVGSAVLDVFVNGEKLLLSSDDVGSDGHYCEIGEVETISNQIKTTSDWSLNVGDILEFVVKGEYSSET